MAKDKKEVYPLNKVNGWLVYKTFSQTTIKTVDNPAIERRYSKFTKWSTLILLFIIHLINFMDRYTFFGVLSAVQVAFEIDKKGAALLFTVFLISFMLLSPVVGYLGQFRLHSSQCNTLLGDRFNRKMIISLVLNRFYFWHFDCWQFWKKNLFGIHFGI